MDILDRAQIFENQHLYSTIALARSAVSSGPGQEFCQHCEERIPPARRRAVSGCRLCIKCQRELEEGTI